MLSFLLDVVAAPAAFLHTPYPPTPFHPRQGGKGGLTAQFGRGAPTALLRAQGRHCFFALRFQANGRRARDAVALANGGRVAARSGRTRTFALTTTASSPTPESTSATRPHACSTVFGAQRPNRLLAPLSALARVERGWGIGGELNSSAGKKPGENK
jgi:hypothetical protein